jgi:hypothetical protein
MARVLALVITAMAILFAPAASARAAPTSPLCESDTYRKAHPLICDTGGPLPNLGGAGGSGNGDDGLIGRIVDGIGGLLGGGGGFL